MMLKGILIPKMPPNRGGTLHATQEPQDLLLHRFWTQDPVSHRSFLLQSHAVLCLFWF